MSLLEHACFKVNCECKNLHINRPRFKKFCVSKEDCRNANCWFTHLPERKMPVLIDELCKKGNDCKLVTCCRIHPERPIVNFVERQHQRCKFGNKCTDDKCDKPGHDLQPVRCRFGSSCYKKTSEVNPCVFSHDKIGSACPFGINCKRGVSCWFAKH